MLETVPADILFHELADGRRLAWREVGEGPSLVMLHGWSMSGAVFQEVATALASDFRVLCPDLCGHGWSEPVTHYSLDCITNDIADWMNALRLPPSAVLGWSLGGQVAMQLARNFSALISRLLLISTTPCFCQNDSWIHGLPETQIRTMRRQLQRAYHKALGDFFDLQFADEQLLTKRRQELLGFNVLSSRLPQTKDCLSALDVLSIVDMRTSLQEIYCPTLVMHGANDKIIPNRAGCYIASAIDRAQLYLLDDIGHAPFMSQPDNCVEIWRKFLNK